MGYKSDSVPLTKLQYGCYLAASLAYLMSFQQDAVGLITHDTTVRDHIPPRQGPAHLRTLLEVLDQTRPTGETGLSAIFNQLAEMIKRRALVVVLSDLFDDPVKLLESLQHFRHKKHEVIVLHMLDPAEMEFPFDDITCVEDAETHRMVHGDARALRKAYLEEFTKFANTMRIGCEGARIDYAVARTDQPFAQFLSNYLARRQKM